MEGTPLGRPVDGAHNLRQSLMLHFGDKERYSRNSLNWEDFFGSSLELAPSLLNIYDDIASSTNQNGHSSSPDQDQQSPDQDPQSPDHDQQSPDQNQQRLLSNRNDPTSSSTSNVSPTTTAASSPPSSILLHPTSPTSTQMDSPIFPNSPPTQPRVPYRNSKLPSLSQPMDRPVSLIDAKSSSLVQPGANRHVDSKKRPLSISSTSSISTSSLPRVRKKRQSKNSPSYYDHNGQENPQGFDRSDCCNVSPSEEDGNRMMCSRMASESHSSMDSGCVENEQHGVDDMSMASSSEAGSIRDDMSSGIQDFVDTSQSSLGHGNNSSPQPSLYSGHVIRHDGFSRSNSTTPEGDRGVGNSSGISDSNLQKSPMTYNETSDVMERMGSYIVRHSDPRTVDGVGSPPMSPSQENDLTNGVRSSEERRRLGSMSRNEARQRFFSNYEQRYSQLYLSPKDGDSDYEMLANSPEIPPSPPINDSVSEIGKEMESDRVSPLLVESSTSLMSAPPPPTTATTISPPTSPSTHPQHPSSSKRLPNARSSRKRESAKSGDLTPTPSSPVYVTYVQRVVTEIVESERTYISSLEDIIYGYLEPLEEMLNMEAAKDDIVCLFSNIREIYDFGRTFLADLEMTSGDPIKVAECFVRHNKGFVIYTEYCTNYPSAVEVLTRFMQHAELSELCKERQTALGHGLPLGAYLLRPVQRILKYHLLLQNIVKSYEKENKDVPVLKHAFQHMTEMAHHINEMKRKHEHAVRIQEIQSQLEDYSGEDLTRLGELVLESTFRVYGAKASRQVFLFERGLLISKKKEGGMLSCKTFIKCSNLMLVEVIPNEPLSFHAIPFNNPRAQYTLQARNMEQKRRWCQEIKRLILESFKGQIPDNVKSLVMELGREHDDDYVTKESLDAVRKHQHTAPQYLEKRRVRKKSGSRMPDFSLLKPNRTKRNGQRKDEKANSRFFLNEPSEGRRAQSKSPEPHRRMLSKLVLLSNSKSQGHSLPDTPMESASNVLYAPNSTTTSQPSSPDKSQTAATSASSTSTKPSSPSVSNLNNESLISTQIRHSHSKTNNRDNRLDTVRRPESFRAAMENRPVDSQNLESMEPQNNRKSNFEEMDEKEPGEIMEPRQRCIRDEVGDVNRSESSDEDDDYVTIREDNDVPPFSQTKDKPNRSSNNSLRGKILAATERKDFDRSESRSSSLPLLLDDCGKEEEIDSVKNYYQSYDNVSNSHIPRGRMSRRFFQKALGGRHNRKSLTHNSVVGESVDEEEKLESDSSERLAVDGDLVHGNALRIQNTSQYLNIPGHTPDQSSGDTKAKMTDWNSVEKLTKGSMTDLSHIHEDPWVANSKIHDSWEDNSSIPNDSSSLQDLSTHPEAKENFDWLVYLKRNSLNPDHALFINHAKRKSTSVLERRGPTKEFIQAGRRISAHESPYATPPRYYMTQENMEIFGQPPNFVSNQEYVNQLDFKTLPRCQSTPNTSSRGVVKADRPYSLELNRVLDENELRDESNRIVAEMEDYISNTPSSENLKIPNKFPQTLPTISIEYDEDENGSNNKRLSNVSSVSTSSYDSTSSDGLVGTLKSKLHSWAAQMSKQNDESEHSCTSPPSSDDDDEDDSKDEEKTLSSTPLSTNTFDPPLNQRNSWQQDRKLEKVLREHSLGSESMGSRMAHTIPSMSEPSKSMPQLQPLPDVISDSDTQNNQFDNENTFLCDKTLPDNSRFSLPTTKEAAEAMMTLNLNSCDIQQSDSGFSLQSNDSTLSDTGENVEPIPDLSQTNEKPPEINSSEEITSTTSDRKSPHPKLSRQNSSESVDSMDSFYERRFSLVLNSEELKESLTIVNVYDDTVDSMEPPPSPQPPKCIKDYVQMLEENTIPKSPQIFQVRARREPGTIIRQRLESLRKNVNYGRSKTCDQMITRNESEEREFTRSKSQPPSQYRTQLHDGNLRKPQCSDDIKVSTLSVVLYGKQELSSSKENINRLSGSRERIENMSRSRERVDSLSKGRERVDSLSKGRERVNSLSKGRERVDSLSKSRDSFNILLSKPINLSSDLSQSRDSLILSKAKESVNNLLRSKENISRPQDVNGKNINFLSLPRSSTPTSMVNSTPYNSSTPSTPTPYHSSTPSTQTPYHSSTPGHEKDWTRFQCLGDEDSPELTTTNQFVYRVPPQVPSSFPDTTHAEITTDPQCEEQDEQSSEVDNLVIMKGWVRALISKFQDK